MAFLALMTSAPVSYSQITYDPSSSAGKQYEIPVDSVRQQVGGGSATGHGSAANTAASTGTSAAASDASLFGQGIKAATHGKTNGAKTNGAKAKSTPTTAGTTSGAGTTAARGSTNLAAPEAVVRAAERSARDPMTGSTGTSWWLYAVGGLLGCGLLTVVLRRSTSGGGTPPAQA